MINKMQNLIVLIPAVILVAVLFVFSPGAGASAQDDTAGLYKSKCTACHGASAEKKFDANKSEDELIQVTLKGKKAEKPPNMPAFEEKGISADQAKALVEFMKSLKK